MSTQNKAVILFIGDIVGKPGRRILAENLENWREEWNVDFVIVNGENAAGGFGLTVNAVKKFRRYGVDLITSGNHILDRKDEIPAVLQEDIVLRPENYVDIPGKGVWSGEIAGVSALVFNLEGLIFMEEEPKRVNPFKKALEIVENSSEVIKILDFHAETTAEKIAMGWLLNGRVSAVLGTHTHVQTADERILPGGTLYITDVGMTGPFDSVIGMDKEGIIRRFITGESERMKIAEDDIRMNAVLLEIDKDTGKGISIRRIEIGFDS